MQTLQYILIIFLCTTSCTHAMDSSLLSMVGSTSEKPKENYIDTLPLEVQGKIVKNIFNLAMQEKLKKYKPSMPVLLGIKFVNEYVRSQRISENKIGGKKFSALEIFAEPRQVRDAFEYIAKPPSFTEGDICADGLKIIKKKASDSIKTGLELTVNHARPSLRCIMRINKFSTFWGFICMFVTLRIPGKYKIEDNRISRLVVFGAGVIIALNQITFYICEKLSGYKYGPTGYLRKVKL